MSGKSCCCRCVTVVAMAKGKRKRKRVLSESENTNKRPRLLLDLNQPPPSHDTGHYHTAYCANDELIPHVADDAASSSGKGKIGDERESISTWVKIKSLLKNILYFV
ncbi:uncharacterized protein LOC114917065 [Cajanus cajan]|uniref:uncharacterized protein LOC114917065 n=1 Tax=Cajanus cajan TaxID=3821 RepID=UPI0010FAD8F1|nr:uncharacterized protein LOC114917065 [Cajanus cajan]